MDPEGDFVKEIIEEFGPVQPFKPNAYYDESGDCIEFMLSQEPFLGKRIDSWVTIYRDERTGEISGGLIKGIRKLMQQFPGLDIEIEDGQVRIACILRAPAHANGDLVAKKAYKAAIQRTEKENVTAEYQLA